MNYLLCFLAGCLITWLRMAFLYRARFEALQDDHDKEMEREFANEKRLDALLRVSQHSGATEFYNTVRDKYESECL